MFKLNFIKIKEFYIKIQKHNISQYAAQSAYYIILSAIPFFMILLTLIQYIGIDRENLYFIIKNIIPTSMNETILGIIQEVYSKTMKTISVQIVFVIWASGKGFYSLYKGLEEIYENKEKSKYIFLKLRAILYTISFSLLIVIALGLMIFGRNLSDYIKEKFQTIDLFEILFIFKDLIIVFVLFFIILLIYKFVPKSKNKLKKQIPGAIIAAIGWLVISKIFSIYLNIFKGFSLMYGSLTTIILIMIWIYLIIYTILLGAEINNFIYNK